MIGTEWFDLAEVESDPTFMLVEASVSHALYACSSSKSAVFADNILLREASFEQEVVTERLLDFYVKGVRKVGNWDSFATARFRLGDRGAIGIVVDGECHPYQYSLDAPVHSTSVGVFVQTGACLRLIEAIISTGGGQEPHSEVLGKVLLHRRSLRELVCSIER